MFSLPPSSQYSLWTDGPQYQDAHLLAGFGLRHFGAPVFAMVFCIGVGALPRGASLPAPAGRTSPGASNRPHGPFGRGTVSLGPPMSIRLDPDLKAILQELANAEDRSLNSYISRALRKHVEAIKRRPKAKS